MSVQGFEEKDGMVIIDIHDITNSSMADKRQLQYTLEQVTELDKIEGEEIKKKQSIGFDIQSFTLSTGEVIVFLIRKRSQINGIHNPEITYGPYIWQDYLEERILQILQDNPCVTYVLENFLGLGHCSDISKCLVSLWKKGKVRMEPYNGEWKFNFLNPVPANQGGVSL